MVIPNLNKLVAKPYVHTYFVDGGISMAKIDFSGTLKTFLVGGLGAGGKGLYALDLTNPTPTDEANAATKIKWEITPTTTGFADLGYTYGTPRIARLNNGVVAAIVGNGYVNGGSGRAVLYLINIDTGALIKAIDTGSGSTTSPNGLSGPTLADTTGDGLVDYAYAGDIDGNLWKFDLTGSNPSSYTVADKDTATTGIQPLFTTSPAQAITTAPGVSPGPNGSGQMVVFATGRILTSGDISDASVHYAYGIWDGAPVANNQLLTQALTAGTHTVNGVATKVRTATANTPDWTAGTGHHYGWKVALPEGGDRVVGEIPTTVNGRYYFVSTDPNTLAQAPNNGDNWLNELVFLTGGSPLGPIFDLNGDGVLTSADLADSCTPTGNITCVPVAKYLTSGVFSQATYVESLKFATTLFTFHPDLPLSGTGGGVPVDPPDPGVSGGHFDFDIYYYGTSAVATTVTPTNLSETKPVCEATGNVSKEYNKLSPTYCSAKYGFSAGYGFLTAYSTGTSTCAKGKSIQSITCNTYTSVTASTAGSYLRIKHVHEYDDKYDVTGVNMLKASDSAFNLSPNVIASATDTTTQFKVLVMNQYLNPAAKLSVGGGAYESVKTFKNLASETNATTLLSGLPTNTRNNIGTLIYNLPLDAFKSKDWWGDGAATRAGLMPTKTGCVNKVNPDGTMVNTSGAGLIGPNGERFDGALAIQLIKADTPASALEFNHNGSGGLTDAARAKYGWRVKQSLFTTYVIAEYTSFWHHPNGKCYGQTGWVPDPPEDFVSNTSAVTPATGSADPKDGTFSGGGGIISTVTTVNGNTTTTVITYTGGLTYTRVDVKNADGTTTVTQTLTDGSTTTTTIPTTAGGIGGAGGISAAESGGSHFGDAGSDSCNGHACSPMEIQAREKVGRLSWRELIK